jgi:hypothetical protein
MQISIDIPSLDDLAAMDEELERIEADLGIILVALAYAQVLGASDSADRLMMLLTKTKVWISVLRSSASVLAIQTTDETKGTMQ